MRILTRSPQQFVSADESVPLASFELERPAKWEIAQTPEAFYARIGDVFALFTDGRCTKALAAQRLLDLLYDFNQSPNGVYGLQAKSRYYLLIFNHIDRIRSTRRSFADVVRGRSITTDQTMYITEVDFSGLSLPGLRVENALFKQCKFDGTDLTHSEFLNCSFEGVTLTGGNLSSSRMMRSSFTGCDFSQIISSRGQRPLRINGCSLVACSFREADLRSADFRKTRMTGCDTLDAKKQDAKGLA
jgi:hypothetical protein